MLHSARSLILAFSIGSLLTLVGCVVDEGDAVIKDPIPGPGDPIPCTTSVLCRLQNPADTIGLDAAQKTKLLTWIEGLDDSVVLALMTVDIDSLGADTVRFKVLSDLQVTIDSSRFVTSPALPPDTITILDWRGYVLAPHTGFVDVTFHGQEFESGFAHLNDKYITLYPLGGNKTLVADDSRVVWMGECSPAMKPGATALSCLP
jgi:hypothetical protein